MPTIRERLTALDLELIPQPPPRHPYVATRRDGDVLYVSGKTAMRNGAVEHAGQLVTRNDLDHGRAAAKLCALQLLSSLDSAVGLDEVTALLKVTGFVASAPGFSWQAEVMNAASELFLDVLGDVGAHARSVVGVAMLPGDSSVEIEAIVRLRTQEER